MMTLGGGHTRSERLLNTVNTTFEAVTSGHLTTEDLRKTVREELSIEFK